MLKPVFTILGWDFARPALWLPLAAWLLMMTASPIAQWIWGDPGILLLTHLGVLAHFAVTFFILLRWWPRNRLLAALLIILPLAWLVEFTGHTTGFPFGDYAYTPLLQPQLGGVPLLIPLAWLMMLPPAWAVAARLVDPRRRFWYAAAAGLAFTAWDLYLDPQMVANDLWVWREPGLYFGIPLTNFAGWWLVSTAITYLIAPRDLPQRPLGVVYTLVWLFQLIGLGVFWNQPWPALCGFAAMGFFAVRFWRKEGWGPAG